jgi:hypothetical protein
MCTGWYTPLECLRLLRVRFRPAQDRVQAAAMVYSVLLHRRSKPRQSPHLPYVAAGVHV